MNYFFIFGSVKKTMLKNKLWMSFFITLLKAVGSNLTNKKVEEGWNWNKI